MRGELLEIYIPYFRRHSGAMANRKQIVKIRSPSVAATIIIEMKPYIIGRLAGMGLRVAGKIVGQQMAASAKPASNAPLPAAAPTRSGRAAGQVAGQATRGVAQGVGGFLRPFRRVGGIIWLEVTGVFFLLPVIVFTPNLWRMRTSYAHGPDHRTFLVTAGVVAVFLYLGVSSFWRARKK
jgi:hypothetical protein